MSDKNAAGETAETRTVAGAPQKTIYAAFLVLRRQQVTTVPNSVPPLNVTQYECGIGRGLIFV